MKYLVFTKRTWDKNNFKNLNPKKFCVLKEFNEKQIIKYNPKIIFFIHWSKIVPAKIFKNYYCVQFHSSDLPRFRGGSPIQNQIIRGIKKTKLSAFKMSEKIDSGEIILKKNLNLNGAAEKIYKEMEKKSLSMIKSIVQKKIKTYPQKGKSSYFKRRSPNESNLNHVNIKNLDFIYDFIRMLDAKGYPNAFIEFKGYKIYLNNVKKQRNKINGNFKIEKK